MSERLKLCKIKKSVTALAQRESASKGQQLSRSISTVIIGPVGLYNEGLRHILKMNHYHNVSQSSNLNISHSLVENDPKIIVFSGAPHSIELNDLIYKIRHNNPAARVVVIIDATSSDQLTEAMKAPAHAFLSADISPTALINALDVVFSNSSVLSINFAEYLTSHQRRCEAKSVKPTPTEQRLILSIRETDILKCLTDGISNKHIARQFGIAESTVKIHVKSILRKIHVQNRTQAAIWALANYPRPEHTESVAANPAQIPAAHYERRVSASAGT